MTKVNDANLLWHAFRYIADELSADETEQFEARLADDQVAREAVARAVELSQAIATLPTEPVSARRAIKQFS